MTSTHYSTLLGIFFSLLVPYSEILLLGRVASNGNESSNVKKLDVDKKPVMFSCTINMLFVFSNDKFGFGRYVIVYFCKSGRDPPNPVLNVIFDHNFPTKNCNIVSQGALPTLLEITRLINKKSLPYSKLLEKRVNFYYPTLPYSVLKKPYSS